MFCYNLCHFRDQEKHLYRRFWNDDLEACILKYCLRYQGEGHGYMRCIIKHCPAGLVTVHREIDYNDLPSDQLNGLKSVCAKLLCQQATSPEDFVTCAITKCGLTRDAPDNKMSHGMVETNGRTDSSSNDIADVLDEMIRFDTCGAKVCGAYHGGSYLRCLKQFCKDTNMDSTNTLKPVSSKRRVNSATAVCLRQNDKACNAAGLSRRDCITRLCP